jgi:hypothetical protein
MVQSFAQALVIYENCSKQDHKNLSKNRADSTEYYE